MMQTLVLLASVIAMGAIFYTIYKAITHDSSKTLH